MSKTDGSFGGIIQAATGRGQGSSSHGTDVDKHSKFVEEMYDQKDDNIQLRKNNAQQFVDSFYNIVTDFYETGWGQSFHFAPRGQNETFRESIIRHEHYIALKLNIQSTDVVLDLGCGIGGPMRNIAEFTGANIVGVTINEYQVNRGNEINKKQGLNNQCILKQGDFCKLSAFKDNSFDKIFAIESTCHAPNRSDVYDQVYRVLKPGGLFASYEWVTTSSFNKNDQNHLKIKYKVEKGNALPDLISDQQVLNSFKNSGFDVIESIDLDQYSRNKGQIPWHASLQSRYALETIQHTYPALVFTNYLTWFLEKISLAPKGTHRAHQILSIARDGLVDAGDLQIFTPMFLVVAQKPLSNDN